MDLVEEARLAVDQMVDFVGGAATEAVLVLSARGVAGSKQRGKARGEMYCHLLQAGKVCMSKRKGRVTRPRLRRKGTSNTEEEWVDEDATSHRSPDD